MERAISSTLLDSRSAMSNIMAGKALTLKAQAPRRVAVYFMATVQKVMKDDG